MPTMSLQKWNDFTQEVTERQVVDFDTYRLQLLYHASHYILSESLSAYPDY